MSPGCLAAAAYVAVLLSRRCRRSRGSEASDSGPARPPVTQTKPAADPVPQLEQALAKSPDDPKVNVALAVAYLDRGDDCARARKAAARGESGA